MDTMTEIDRPTDSPISASPGTDYRDYVNSILEYIAACHRQADLDPKAKQHLTKIAGYLLDMIDRLELAPAQIDPDDILRRFGPTGRVN